MNTDIGNKLIAEFDKDFYCYPNYGFGNNETGIVWHSADELQYHTSWDWLQPAWSKFYVLCETTLRGKENLYNVFTGFSDDYNTHANHNNVGAACETLIEAIKWYNQNK